MSVSSIFTEWSQFGHLGPRDSKIVSGHLQLHATFSRRMVRPWNLGILGGLHASQKVLTSRSQVWRPRPNTQERWVKVLVDY